MTAWALALAGGVTAAAVVLSGTVGRESRSGTGTGGGSIMEAIGMDNATDALYTPRYFSPGEFGGWFEQMAPELLRKLDRFREQWGGRVVVSPVAGGVGRHLGEGDQSQHNVDQWGEVRAVDFFPQVRDLAGRWRYINSAAEIRRAYEVARAVGFTGIGVYTDTAPGYMVHGDVRPDREPGDPATWARVSGEYRGVSFAWT